MYGSFVATEEVKRSIEAMERSLAGAKSDVELLRVSDPDSQLIADLEDAIASTEVLRARTLLEATFGDLEVIADDSSDADRRAISQAKDIERNNHVRDGVALAHSTLFAEADGH